MASLKLLLSHARRQYLLKTPPSSSSPFLHFSKSLSSSSSSSSNNDDSSPPKPQPSPIQPVSYSAKPKPPRPESETLDLASQPPQQQQQESPSDTISPPPPRGDSIDSAWTREDIRYVKDAGPSISPISYPARVAPLPEDRVREEEGSKDEMKPETRRFEAENSSRRILRRTRVPKMFEEEEVKVPFPTLIKVEKKEKKAVYDLAEAIRLVKANAKANFNETVEAHVRLAIERKRSDLIVRGSLVLPHGGGMKVAKIAFLGEGADADEARAAGADIVGGAELVEQIANSGGKFDVQKCFTTPAFMPNVLKIAKILKPLGLLPNAKQGTLISDVARAVREAKQSNVDFKMDKTSIVHVGLGKVNLSEEDLRENIGAFVNALLRAKPAGLKKASKYAGYVDAFHICSTMGPGFPVSIQSLSKAADHFNKVHLS